ncbi:amidohydrolase [Microscilla marina]|uniref:Urease domain protein n=1 Tax=Microscilla marina ATCC 23134 TaxID=313606 RepID=A1ZK55_MICM2|nr:amidohydrolase [Microscilla marina]EAY29081.1 urease domain protein [Microscilla marina ATCC 23134]
MKIFTYIIQACLAIVLFGASACKKDAQPQVQDASEKLFINGKIYTVNNAALWAEAILVKDGVITYVGTTAQAKAQASANAQVIDLQGQMMMPGIHDVHMHPLEASTNNFKFNLSNAETNPENYAATVKQAIKDHPGTGWLLGAGHSLTTILAATRAPRLILDELSSTRPIGIMEQTSHSFWCNSKALEVLGISQLTPDPQGGIIVREANGAPNGLLIDNAGELLAEAALKATNAKEATDYQGLVEFALPEMAKYGITSACEARTFWKRNYHKVWQRIEAEGKLTARVTLALWAYPAEDDASQIQTLKSLYTNDDTKLLRINQIKLYMDGIIHNTTAALHTNYQQDVLGNGIGNGLNYFTQTRLASYIAQLESTGFDFFIHSIGNRGTTEALNAIEKSGTAQGRHRLTHLEMVQTSDLARFNALNVTADCQVAGSFTHPDHWSENAALVGTALANDLVPLKNLVNAKARLTLSSDWDVSTLNPFVGMQNAVTRSPQEISLAEAVKAYTINAAYTMRQENKVGTIEIGKEADLIVLDRDIFSISPSTIGQTQVVQTYLRGKLVYQK